MRACAQSTWASTSLKASSSRCSTCRRPAPYRPPPARPQPPLAPPQPPLARPRNPHRAPSPARSPARSCRARPRRRSRGAESSPSCSWRSRRSWCVTRRPRTPRVGAGSASRLRGVRPPPRCPPRRSRRSVAPCAMCWWRSTCTRASDLAPSARPRWCTSTPSRASLPCSARSRAWRRWRRRRRRRLGRSPPALWGLAVEAP